MSAIIDDTYAEAFRSIYVEFLVTAKNRKWLDHALNALTGNASSTISRASPGQATTKGWQL